MRLCTTVSKVFLFSTFPLLLADFLTILFVPVTFGLL